MRTYAQDSPLDPSQPAGQPADATLPQDVKPGQAADASQQGTLGKLWNAWTSRPENNAAMINFGLQLMQPRAPGQTALGHWAEAAGAGAEATQRNVKAEEERQQAEEKMALEERKVASSEELSKAHSQYYLTRNQGDKLSLKQQSAKEALWNRYRLSKEPQDDILNPGSSTDTTLNLMRRATNRPKLTKTEMLADPVLSAQAERLVKGEGGGGGVAGPTMAPEDAQALDWARTHPDDPRAAQIMSRLGRQ